MADKLLSDVSRFDPTVYRGLWVAGSYPSNSIVTSSGVSYVSLVNTAGVPGVSVDWQPIGSPALLSPATTPLLGAELWDDFNRADTALGVVTNPPTGQTYGLRGSPDVNTGVVQILGGKLVNTQNSVIYLGGEMIAGKVANMGAIVEWVVPSSPGSYPDPFTRLVFLICPTSAWLDKLIHVVIDRQRCAIEISSGGGVGNVVVRASVDSAAGYWVPVDGTPTAYEVIIEGDTILLTCAGQKILSYTGSDVGLVNGKFVYYESYKGGQHDNMKIVRLWCNEKRNGGAGIYQRTHPYSAKLAKLASGKFDFDNGGAVERNNIDIKLGILTTDGVTSRLNRSYGGLGTYRASGSYLRNTTVTNCAATTASAGPGTGIGTLTIVNTLLQSFSLAKNGDRVRIVVMGGFAGNANTKEVMFNFFSIVLWPGLLVNNGGAWKMTVELWRSATSNWNGNMVFESTAGTVVKQVLGAGMTDASNVNFTMGIGGIAASDTSISAILVEALPAP